MRSSERRKREREAKERECEGKPGGGGGGLDLAWRKCWLARVRRQPGKGLAQAGRQAGWEEEGGW